MPFNYQTLKNITSAAIIDGSITNAELATASITDAKIADTTITSGKFATGAVDLSTSTVTGTTPFSKGGTEATALGSSYHVLRTNAANNALEFSDSGIRRMVVFTGSGTYTKTAGARYALVQVQGPGGGASGHGESGAAGGYAERLVDISGVSTVSVTINGGGGGTYYSGPGGNAGGSCSFGPYVSASGGHGANRHNQHNGGLPGVGSGGDLNIYGGAGGGHEQRSSGMGGSSFFGGAAPAGHPQGGNFAHNHQGYSANGTGGTSGYFSGHRGSDGRPGMIVITEYF
jgi:hypothetical protein